MHKPSTVEKYLHILFPLPAILFIALLMIFPILYTLSLSFTNWNLTSGAPMRFVGLRNFEQVLVEPRFVDAILRTLGFTVFVGLNLLQSAFTGFCPLAVILKKVGVRPGWVLTSSSTSRRVPSAVSSKRRSAREAPRQPSA